MCHLQRILQTVLHHHQPLPHTSTPRSTACTTCSAPRTGSSPPVPTDRHGQYTQRNRTLMHMPHPPAPRVLPRVRVVALLYGAPRVHNVLDGWLHVAWGGSNVAQYLFVPHEKHEGANLIRHAPAFCAVPWLAGSSRSLPGPYPAPSWRCGGVGASLTTPTTRAPAPRPAPCPLSPPSNPHPHPTAKRTATPVSTHSSPLPKISTTWDPRELATVSWPTQAYGFASWHVPRLRLRCSPVRLALLIIYARAFNTGFRSPKAPPPAQPLFS